MKKTILVAAALISCLVVQAQINKGRTMLGGSLRYSQDKKGDGSISNYPSTETKFMTAGVYAMYGVFISDHIMIGIMGNGNTYKNVYTTSDASQIVSKQTIQSNYAGGGVFGRYYQMLGKTRFAVFGQLSANYTSGKQTTKQENISNPSFSSTTTGKGSTFNCWVNPGLTYFVNKTLALETGIGYLGYSGDKMVTKNGPSTNETKSSGIEFNFLQNFSLGINFYFGKTTEPAPEKINP